MRKTEKFNDLLHSVPLQSRQPAHNNAQVLLTLSILRKQLVDGNDKGDPSFVWLISTQHFPPVEEGHSRDGKVHDKQQNA